MASGDLFVSVHVSPVVAVPNILHHLFIHLDDRLLPFPFPRLRVITITWEAFLINFTCFSARLRSIQKSKPPCGTHPRRHSHTSLLVAKKQTIPSGKSSSGAPSWDRNWNSRLGVELSWVEWSDGVSKEFVVSGPCRRCALGFICVGPNCKKKRGEICVIRWGGSVLGEGA